MIIQKHYAFAFDFPLSFIRSSVAKKVESKSLRRRKKETSHSAFIVSRAGGHRKRSELIPLSYLIGSGGKGSRKNVKSKEELQLEII